MKKKGCCLFTLIKWIVIAFAVLAIMTLFTSTSDTNTASSGAEVASTSAPAATVAPTATPSTREEWVQRAAEEVYGDDLISITWQEVDNQKDMIVIWCQFKDNLTNNLRRTMFMMDAENMLKRVAQLGKDGYIEYGSCYIVGRTTYLDTYGNEFDGNAMEIRLKAGDLEKINWDNITSDMLVNLATTYAVHPLFRD